MEKCKRKFSQASAAAGGSEIAKAKEAVCERGNKLNEVEEKTEQMANDAKVPLSFVLFSLLVILPVCFSSDLG